MLLFHFARERRRGESERGCRCQAAGGDTDGPQLRLEVAGGADAAGVVAIWYRDAYKGYFHHNPFYHFALNGLIFTVGPHFTPSAFLFDK